MIAFERSRHDHEICISNFGCARRVKFTSAHHLLKHSFHTGFDDVKMAGIGLFNHRGIDVDTDNIDTAFFGSNIGCGQADIAKSHKTCFHIVFII